MKLPHVAPSVLSTPRGTQVGELADRRDPVRRIALVCDWYLPRIGGIERHLASLARHLAATGREVTVITPTPGACDDVPGVSVQRMPAFLMPGVGLIWTPPSFRRLGEFIRRGGFDVVHVHSSIISPAAFAAAQHAQKAGLPTVITVHSILGGFTGTFRQLDRLFHWSRWPVLFSSVSERVAQDLRPLAAPRAVAVLHNALDPAAWRLPHHPPADEVTIACVMRLVPRKRGAVLLRALRTVRSKLPQSARFRLAIAGDGPARRGLERLADSLQLRDCVQFLGAVSPAEVKTLLGSSHFFALPCKAEAFGIAALEARAAGLPVVGMRESGVSEFIVDGRDGLLADDDDQLAEHLYRLITDAELRERMTAHNLAVPVTCTWERILPAHLRAYERARELVGASASLRM